MNVYRIVMTIDTTATVGGDAMIAAVEDAVEKAVRDHSGNNQHIVNAVIATLEPA